MAIERDAARWGRWETAAEELVSYRYLGCRSVVVDVAHATGTMALRSDMRWSAGLLGSPLAIAMLDTAGINIDAIRFGALTHVTLQVHSDSAAVRRLRFDGEVSRMAKRAIFTEAVIVDELCPAHVVAHGSADWVSMGEVAPDSPISIPAQVFRTNHQCVRCVRLTSCSPNPAAGTRSPSSARGRRPAAPPRSDNGGARVARQGPRRAGCCR